MLEMQIVGLTIDPTNQTPVVLLQENGSENIFPIWLSAMEALNLSHALRWRDLAHSTHQDDGALPTTEESPSLPSSHELVLLTLKRLRGRLLAAEITEIRDDILHASLRLDTTATSATITCHAADAIILSVYAQAPLRVHPDVVAGYTIHAPQNFSDYSKKNPKAPLLNPTKEHGADAASSKKKGAKKPSVAPIIQRREMADETKLMALLRMLDPISPNKM